MPVWRHSSEVALARSPSARRPYAIAQVHVADAPADAHATAATISGLRQARASVKEVQEFVIALAVSLHEQFPIGLDLYAVIVQDLQIGQRLPEALQRCTQKIGQWTRFAIEVEKHQPEQGLGSHCAQRNILATDRSTRVPLRARNEEALALRRKGPMMIEALNALVGSVPAESRKSCAPRCGHALRKRVLRRLPRAPRKPISA